jgi:hypothetical protein
MREAVQRIYRERKSLVSSLQVRVLGPSIIGWTGLKSVLGRQFGRREAGCSPPRRGSSHHSLHLSADFQPGEYPDLSGSPRNHCAWIFVHLWAFGTTTLRIHDLHFQYSHLRHRRLSHD